MSAIQDRRNVWSDETVPPWSAASRIAHAETGANLTLFDSYVDHVDGDQDWMTYPTWLEGELQISIEMGSGELRSCQDWITHHKYLNDLFYELDKITTEHFNDDGLSATDVELLARRKQQEFQAACERAEENMPSAITESIIGIDGELYVRYEPSTQTFKGFGFMPSGDATPGFHHIDGPQPDCNPNEWDSPVWAGMREHLENVFHISGEWSFAVIWTEDGWRVKR